MHSKVDLGGFEWMMGWWREGGLALLSPIHCMIIILARVHELVARGCCFPCVV